MRAFTQPFVTSSSLKKAPSSEGTADISKILATRKEEKEKETGKEKQEEEKEKEKEKEAEEEKEEKEKDEKFSEAVAARKRELLKEWSLKASKTPNSKKSDIHEEKGKDIQSGGSRKGKENGKEKGKRNEESPRPSQTPPSLPPLPYHLASPPPAPPREEKIINVIDLDDDEDEDALL